MTRTQARSDCGHCSNGPKTVDDQSSSRILAPISPPPANTDSINCVLLGSFMMRSVKPFRSPIEPARAQMTATLEFYPAVIVVRINGGEPREAFPHIGTASDRVWRLYSRRRLGRATGGVLGTSYMR